MKKIITFSVLAAFLLSGCKDFLAERSQDQYIPRTTTDLLEMLAGEAYGTTAYTTLTETMDDDVACSRGLSESGYMPREFTFLPALKSIHTWQPTMYGEIDRTNATASSYNLVYQKYAEMYTYIAGCNIALDYLDRVSGPEDDKNQIIAEARTFRALYYFILVNLYGAPYSYDKTAMGVPLKLVAGFQETELRRSTVEQVYEQILTDLDLAEKAFAKLDDIIKYPMNVRPSLGMLYLLKSRVCLYMENWSESARYADLVIESGKYTLKDFGSMAADTTLAKEGTIIGFRSTRNLSALDPKNPETVWSYGWANGVDLVSSTFFGLKYAGVVLNSKERYQFVASEALVSSYEKNDLRRFFYLVRQQKGADTIPSKELEYTAFAKQPIQAYLPTGNSYPAYCFRLAEAYLNKAEALAMMGGREAEARETLNILRRKRFEPGTNAEVPATVTGQDLVDYARAERRRELNFEGHRWFDLRRQGMPPITHTWREAGIAIGSYTLTKEDPAYTLLLPPDAMIHNKALDQNPMAPNRNPL